MLFLISPAKSLDYDTPVPAGLPHTVDILRLIHDHGPHCHTCRVPTLLLIRHGRTTANAAGTLAGWTPGIGLDEVGRDQAARLAERLAALPVCRVVASPLQRIHVATASGAQVPLANF